MRLFPRLDGRFNNYDRGILTRLPFDRVMIRESVLVYAALFCAVNGMISGILSITPFRVSAARASVPGRMLGISDVTPSGAETMAIRTQVKSQSILTDVRVSAEKLLDEVVV
jgi:hypothetical protein